MRFNPKKLFRELHGVIFTTVIVIAFVQILRVSGCLQLSEWPVLNIFFQLRPLEPTDKRILIVTVGESDIKKLKQWPVSDRVLAKLLIKLSRQRPRVIGLDLYRNIPVGSGYEELVQVFKNTPNLIGIEKVIGDSFTRIPPPPILKQLKRVSSNDIVVDGDGVVRRAILFPGSEGNEALPSLGLATALNYLKDEGILPKPKVADNDPLTLNGKAFVPFEASDGGYVRSDAGGYKILFNFRGPAQSFAKVSLTDVLEDRVESDLMRDRIVLIGSQAPSLNDLFYTPYSKILTTTPIRTHGVEIQANLASQIISSVLDERPLLTGANELLENFIIVLVATIISALAWTKRRTSSTKNFSAKFLTTIAVAVVVVGVGLVSASYLAFLLGLWIPVVAPLLTLFSSAIAISGYVYIDKLQESKEDLKNALAELQESQARLRLALAVACTGIWDWNLQTGEVEISGNCDRLLGLETDCFKGSFNDFIEKIYSEDRNDFTRLINLSRSQKTIFDKEFRVLWSLSGEPDWLHAEYQVYCDEAGNPKRMLGTIKKFTELKLAAEAFRRKEATWRALIQNSSDIVMILSPSYEIQYVSPSVQNILGYSASNAEYIGQNFLEFIYPDEINGLVEIIEEALKDSTANLIFEYRHLHKRGNWKFIESVVSNQISISSIAGIVFNSRDISERKQTEIVLHNTESRLKEFEIVNE